MTSLKLIELVTEGTFGDIYLCVYKNMLQITKIIKFKESNCISLKSIIRETFLLKKLNHKNLMKANNISIKQEGNYYNIYYIMDIYPHDLSSQLEQWSKKPNFTINSYRTILTQLFEGVYYMHQNDILHRDLKPENILINSDLQIKICDFGISKIVNTDTIPHLEKDYVQTLWYRAPEVFMLECCNKKSDIWSIGCIMYDLWTCRRNVLFGYNKMRKVFYSILKTFKVTDIDKKILKEYRLHQVNILKNCEQFDLLKRLNQNEVKLLKDSHDFIDLFLHIMKFDYKKRYSIEDCFKHKFINIKEPIVEKIYKDDNIKMIDCLPSNISLETGSKTYITIDHQRIHGKDMLYILNQLLQSH